MSINVDNEINSREIARTIAWGAWLSNFKASNPDADQAAINSAWKEVRDEQIVAGRRAINALEKAGYAIVPTT
jgi:hypothetical protein